MSNLPESIYIWRTTRKLAKGIGTINNAGLKKFKHIEFIKSKGDKYKIKDVDFEALFHKIHVEEPTNPKCYIAERKGKSALLDSVDGAKTLRKLCSNAVHAGPVSFEDFKISSIGDLKSRANKIVYISDVFDYKIEGKKKSKKKKKKMINSYFETFLAEVYG
eukprot:841089_1